MKSTSLAVAVVTVAALTAAAIYTERRFRRSGGGKKKQQGNSGTDYFVDAAGVIHHGYTDMQPQSVSKEMERGNIEFRVNVKDF